MSKRGPTEEHVQDEELGKSKSRLKREMHELQDFARHILDLRGDQIDSLPLSDRLRSALEEAGRIRQHEARRRHLQYMGKIVRLEDNLDELMRAVAALDAGSAENTRRLHLAEQWRDRLIAEGDAVVAEFIDFSQDIDVQHFRNLVRNARREARQDKNTGQSRKLFRFVRECIDQVSD